MAYGKYTNTINLYALTGRVAARLSTDPDSVVAAFNVRDTTDATAQYVAVVNERQRWLFGENPLLGQTTTSLSLVTGTTAYNVPSDLFQTDYEDIQFDDENDWSYRLPINYLNAVDFRALPASVQFEQGIGPYPAFFTFNPTASQIVFTGFSQNWSLLVTYRANPTPMVVADINDAASTTYLTIPNDFIDVLVLAIAIEIGERQNLDTRRLHEILYERNSPDEPGKLRKMQDTLATSGAGTNRPMMTQGTPYTSLMPKRFAGIGSRRYRGF